MTQRILIVEDNPVDLRLFEQALSSAEREVVSCADGRAALAAFEKHAADVVVSDIVMPNMEGTELLRELHRRVPGLPVILVTRYGSIAAAVAAMRAGAFDYVTKPVEIFELQTRVARALERSQLRRENATLRQELAAGFGPESVVAESAHSRALMELVRRIAASDATVLIQGESGTGKELIARLVHYWSDRVGRPFVAVNCKAFAESVLESELFGHEKGAFTGAIAARQGCFERASGGTLLLDEIGDISPEFQAKLLRVLQEGEVLRVGGAEPRRINVRVVAATNTALKDKVAAGSFREDLYFRLNVIPIVLAALRERREDILPLARHFLERFAARAGRHMTLGPDAESMLLEHSWPGNVRELENAIERAVVLTRADVIGAGDLMLDRVGGALHRGEAASTQPPPDPPRPAASAADNDSNHRTSAREIHDVSLTEYLDKAAGERIAQALAKAKGNRAEAARNLGIGRATLYRFMRRLGNEHSYPRRDNDSNGAR
ncbi:MAG TPA: sigma-54 dependent transcriptional regulator [Candidatus Binataceae bacterium]|jgi:DNA-binding NtrC family response regulator|nr:sigma-54 dependent transcriptional regulator [Candidatus Binataceae bacterium]